MMRSRPLPCLGAFLAVVVLLLAAPSAMSQEPAGPYLVLDAIPGAEGSLPVDYSGGFAQPGSFATAGGVLYYAATDTEHGRELWRSDGTEAVTYMVRNIAPGSYWSTPRLLTAVGDTVYFVANDFVTGGELWRTDGTEAGTAATVRLANRRRKTPRAAPRPSGARSRRERPLG